jgi:transcriptional regulator with XRE-family HTH domain
MNLRELRHEIGFSMADVAACLGIPKSTLQRYEDGSAKPPAAVVRAALELKQINVTFMAELPARVDARATIEYPHGIMSEVTHEW